MKKLLVALMLVAAPAWAVDWPWQSQTKANYGYCKGFVYSALGAYPMDGLSRTRLWLSWNNIIRAGYATTDASDPQYLEGQTAFDNLTASNDSASVLQIANGECNLENG
ncbi:MAG: hypothetical protein AAF699_09810 [Pseudomonadota bacterium]